MADQLEDYEALVGESGGTGNSMPVETGISSSQSTQRDIEDGEIPNPPSGSPRLPRPPAINHPSPTAISTPRDPSMHPSRQHTIATEQPLPTTEFEMAPPPPVRTSTNNFPLGGNGGRWGGPGGGSGWGSTPSSFTNTHTGGQQNPVPSTPVVNPSSDATGAWGLESLTPTPAPKQEPVVDNGWGVPQQNSPNARFKPSIPTPKPSNSSWNTSDPWSNSSNITTHSSGPAAIGNNEKGGWGSSETPNNDTAGLGNPNMGNNGGGAGRWGSSPTVNNDRGGEGFGNSNPANNEGGGGSWGGNTGNNEGGGGGWGGNASWGNAGEGNNRFEGPRNPNDGNGQGNRGTGGPRGRVRGGNGNRDGFGNSRGRGNPPRGRGNSSFHDNRPRREQDPWGGGNDENGFSDPVRAPAVQDGNVGNWGSGSQGPPVSAPSVENHGGWGDGSTNNNTGWWNGGANNDTSLGNGIRNNDTVWGDGGVAKGNAGVAQPSTSQMPLPAMPQQEARFEELSNFTATAPDPARMDINLAPPIMRISNLRTLLSRYRAQAKKADSLKASSILPLASADPGISQQMAERSQRAHDQAAKIERCYYDTASLFPEELRFRLLEEADIHFAHVKEFDTKPGGNWEALGKWKPGTPLATAPSKASKATPGATRGKMPAPLQPPPRRNPPQRSAWGEFDGGEQSGSSSSNYRGGGRGGRAYEPGPGAGRGNHRGRGGGAPNGNNHSQWNQNQNTGMVNDSSSTPGWGVGNLGASGNVGGSAGVQAQEAQNEPLDDCGGWG